MVVDHIGGVSPLYVITGGNRFFVSAAEGFVFISGYLVGIVYGGEVRRAGWLAGAQKALRRAFTLYALSVWLAVTFAPISRLFDLPWAPDFNQTPIGEFVLEVVTFRRAYYLVDVIQLYTLLLLLAPLPLLLLARRQWWWVFGGSAALWAAYHLSVGQFQVPWPIQDNLVFHFGAWQILFFFAMVLGFERDWFGRRWQAITAGVRSRLPGGWLLVLTGLLAAMIWLHNTNAAILGQLGLVADPAATLESLFNKTALPPLRLIASGIVFAFGWNLVSHAWPIARRVTGWLLLPLGTRALYAYAAHIFVIVVMLVAPAYLPAPIGHALSSGSALSNLVLQLITLMGVWAIVHWRLLPRLVSWLGQAPLRPAETRQGLRWQATPSLTALLIIALAGAVTSDSYWPGSMNVLATGMPAANQTAVKSPSVEPTALAGRSIGEPGSRPGDQLRAVLDGTPIADIHLDTVASFGMLDERFYSEALEREMPFGVYLPPGYAPDSSRRYPVLYLLHGAPTNYTEWPRLGVGEIADALIATGEIEPMIVIFPQGEGSYYFNHPGGLNWGDYIARDLVDCVDATFRTIPDRASRAIGGLSMGGFGALQLGLNYPEVFGVVGAHGPALRTYDERLPFFGTPDEFAQIDPLALIQTAPQKPIITWLDAGERDQWAERLWQLHQAFDERGWPNEFHIFPGDHTTDYWRANAHEYVTFYATSLKGEQGFSIPEEESD